MSGAWERGIYTASTLAGFGAFGQAAAATQAAVRKKIDAELTARAGQEAVNCTRRTLAMLIDLGYQGEPESVGGH